MGQIQRDRADLPATGHQVADRWHLWNNLAEAVERAVSRHR
jgi:hypothetical protein